jgi:hypothetical protein
LTAVLDAYPVIVLGVALAGRTCLISNPITELAGTATVGTMTTPSIETVAVDWDVAVFDITILVTTAVVLVVGAV